MRPNDQMHDKMLGLEVIRFFAAVSVLVFHYKNFTYEGLQQVEKNLGALPLYDALWFFYTYGDYGVQAFWTLSGFIFYFKYFDTVSRGLVSGWKFFVLRFSRLYPLHILTLLAVAAFQFGYTSVNGSPFACGGNDSFHFLLHLFMASNWRGQWGLSFNAPVWSVSVEVLIYALFFLMLRLGIRSIWSCAVLVAACAAARHFHIDNRVVMCISFFFAGGMAALLMQKAHANGRSNALRKLTGALAVLLPLAYVSVFFQGGHGDQELLFLNLWVPCLVICLAQVHIPTTNRMASGLEVAGNVTYASYLIHFPIQVAVALCFTWMGDSVPFGSPVLLTAYVLGTLALSVPVYRLFEMPAQKHIRRLLLRQ